MAVELIGKSCNIMKRRLFRFCGLVVLIGIISKSAYAQADSVKHFELRLAIGHAQFHFDGVEDDQLRFVESVKDPLEKIPSFGFPQNYELAIGISRGLFNNLSLGILVSDYQKNYSKMADTSVAYVTTKYELSYFIRQISPRIVVDYVVSVHALSGLRMGLSMEGGPAFINVKKEMRVYPLPGTMAIGDSASTLWLLANHLRGNYQAAVLDWRIGVSLQYEILRDCKLTLSATLDNGVAKIVPGNYTIGGRPALRESNTLLESYFGDLSIGHCGTIFAVSLVVPIFE
jgi:hypothetical protein